MYRIEVLPGIPGKCDQGQEFEADTLEQAKKKIDELVTQHIWLLLEPDRVDSRGRVVIMLLCKDPDANDGSLKSIEINHKAGSKCVEVSYWGESKIM